MKAIVNTEYGSPEVLELKDVAKPIPLDDEILIRVKATAVNSGDWRMRKADPFGVRLFFGLLKPKRNILGGVFSGEIEGIGKTVSRFKVGDHVFGTTGMTFGAYAQYKCVNEKGVVAIKPERLSHREAAVIPFGGTTALHFLKKANIKPGQKVIVNGASGAVGTAAVQLAKHLGADVTGICSTGNMNLVRSLGADRVIDYTKEDFTENGETYDVIFDTVKTISFSRSIKSLKAKGILISSAAGISEMFQGLWTSMISDKKVLTGMITERAEDVVFLRDLIDAGKFRPVIDKSYPLEQMAAAHAYVELGHKKGNVAIEVS